MTTEFNHVNITGGLIASLVQVCLDCSGILREHKLNVYEIIQRKEKKLERRDLPKLVQVLLGTCRNWFHQGAARNAFFRHSNYVLCILYFSLPESFFFLLMVLMKVQPVETSYRSFFEPNFEDMPRSKISTD